jgi:hypothetical protein
LASPPNGIARQVVELDQGSATIALSVPAISARTEVA